MTADDDARVEKVDLWIDGVQQAIDLTEPYSFTIDSTALSNGSHTFEARAYDLDGRRTTASRTVTVSNGASGSDVVLYASEAPVRAGSWRVVTDASAAGGRRLEHPQAGAATIDPPLANPVGFVELAVNVMPDTNYRLWLCKAWHSGSGAGHTAGVRRRAVRVGRTSATWSTCRTCAAGLTRVATRDNGHAGLSDRHGIGDAGQPAGLRRLHDQWLGMAGQRLRHGRPRTGAEVRDRRRADDQDPGARGWRVDRSGRDCRRRLTSAARRARSRTTRRSWRSS